MRRPSILLLAVALLAVSPLLAFGPSCGHDFGFHLQSWLDAERQLRHGTLHPHWIFSAAYNAGEPRFVFYPPLSWLFGELLALLLPAAALPAAFTLCILAAAAFSFHRLARAFVPTHAAVLAATLYAVNPYMLFTAYERTAYAELMAAIWMPLLFLAILRDKPTARGIALPIALLWLTNAPAAVMGSYTLVALAAVRLAFHLRRSDPVLPLVRASAGGAALGLALSAFYLLPAAYERRFVQINMAVIPNMRVEDNFLFGHTGDIPHDLVLHQASVLAVILLLLTFAAVGWLLLRTRNAAASRSTLTSLAVLPLGIAFLLFSPSLVFWQHVPELRFLQFPWRLLSVLAVVCALATALALQRVPLRSPYTAAVSLVLSAALTALGIHAFRQGCDLSDLPVSVAQELRARHGVAPIDEYTPGNADNDTLRTDDPSFWFATNPQAFADGTTPNPAQPPEAAAAPSIPRPLTNTAFPASNNTSFPAYAPSAGYLILNLRDYPNWHVTLDDANGLHRLDPPHAGRPDGLIALQVHKPGAYRVHIQWRRSWDEWLGWAISFAAAIVYAALLWRNPSRRMVS